MAPGDLNLKKSWFPKLKKNQAKIWEMEQDALNEHKRIQERQLEFTKERQKKELIDLQIKNNPNLKNKLISNRIDWMYDDPTGDSTITDKDKDDYLLGRKKINFNKPTAKNTIDKNDRLSKVLSTPQSSKDLSNDDPMQKINTHRTRQLQILKQEQILKDKQSRESSRVRPSNRSHHHSHKSHRSHTVPRS